MPILVNDYEITDADMERELPHHQDAPNPSRRATTAIVLRRVLLDEARRLGISARDDEATIEALLAHAVPPTQPSREECERYYASNAQRFTVGELVEAEHILFQVTPNLDLNGLRKRAEKTLAELVAQPALFAERARTLSNCPSGEVGGNLGQLSRGDTVPEFEKAIFSLTPGVIQDSLVETRFGLHIVRVARHIAGKLLPFDKVEAQISAVLSASRQDAASRQYLQTLIDQSRIEGVELEGAASPLVQ